ncbi:unnamed protein product [Cuscuta campestris]|uniref:Uncharacterized protein n=1 Tax=Cuscuta campestris TaxID=132261 RepID=A0A484NJR7_9ASTE|nr:unnamed protein product [Cuscuta campestris]
MKDNDQVREVAALAVEQPWIKLVQLAVATSTARKSNECTKSSCFLDVSGLPDMQPGRQQRWTNICSELRGVEWSLDSDASNTAVLVASEAHAVTLAIEGLLGIVFAVATLTDEAVDFGELESPRFEVGPPTKCTGKTAMLCTSMVDSMWLTILDALSFILTKSQGEAIVLEILKGYQAFTQSCGVLRAVEPLNSFLASLCKFTIGIPNEVERRR